MKGGEDLGFGDHVLAVGGEVVHCVFAEPGCYCCLEGREIRGGLMCVGVCFGGGGKNKSGEFGLISECEGAPY